MRCFAQGLRSEINLWRSSGIFDLFLNRFIIYPLNETLLFYHAIHSVSSNSRALPSPPVFSLISSPQLVEIRTSRSESIPKSLWRTLKVFRSTSYNGSMVFCCRRGSMHSHDARWQKSWTGCWCEGGESNEVFNCCKFYSYCQVHDLSFTIVAF